MFVILGSWALRPVYMAVIGAIVAGRTLLVAGGVGLLGLRKLVTGRSLMERHGSIE